jgi:hypothetical protein
MKPHSVTKIQLDSNLNQELKQKMQDLKEGTSVEETIISKDMEGGESEICVELKLRSNKHTNNPAIDKMMHQGSSEIEIESVRDRDLFVYLNQIANSRLRLFNSGNYGAL